MRLSQLARQLNVDASKIVAHLSKEGIEIENAPNTKLEEAHIESATKEFEVKEEIKVEAPKEIKSAEEKLAEISGAKTKEVVEEAPKEAPETIEVPTSNEETDTNATIVAEVPEATPPAPEAEKVILPGTKIELGDDTEKPQVIKAELEKDPIVDDEAELIKAPKIELEGIKVVGKIDLPEKPKPEVTEVKEEEEEEIATEPIDPNAPKVHPSKLAKQKANEAISTPTQFLPPTPEKTENKKKPVQEQNEPGTKKKNRKRADKDYEPLWQKKQTYFSDKKEEKAAAKAEKKRSWLGRFFHWWTTE